MRTFNYLSVTFSVARALRETVRCKPLLGTAGRLDFSPVTMGRPRRQEPVVTRHSPLQETWGCSARALNRPVGRPDACAADLQRTPWFSELFGFAPCAQEAEGPLQQQSVNFWGRGHSPGSAAWYLGPWRPRTAKLGFTNTSFQRSPPGTPGWAWPAASTWAGEGRTGCCRGRR